MAFLMLPIVAVLSLLGVGIQAWRLAQAVPGAGVPGRVEAVANISVQQALVSGVVCVAIVSTTPDPISVSILPAPPVGVSTPTGAVCMVVARAGGGHDIHGYVPMVPGAAGSLIQSTQGNAA